MSQRYVCDTCGWLIEADDAGAFSYECDDDSGIYTLCHGLNECAEYHTCGQCGELFAAHVGKNCPKKTTKKGATK